MELNKTQTSQSAFSKAELVSLRHSYGQWFDWVDSADLVICLWFCTQGSWETVWATITWRFTLLAFLHSSAGPCCVWSRGWRPGKRGRRPTPRPKPQRRCWSTRAPHRTARPKTLNLSSEEPAGRTFTAQRLSDVCVSERVCVQRVYVILYPCRNCHQTELLREWDFWAIHL